MISSTLSGENHLMSLSRLNHVSCLRQYLCVLHFILNMASSNVQSDEPSSMTMMRNENLDADNEV